MYLNCTDNYDVAKIKVKSVTDHQYGAQNVSNSTKSSVQLSLMLDSCYFTLFVIATESVSIKYNFHFENAL